MEAWQRIPNWGFAELFPDVTRLSRPKHSMCGWPRVWCFSEVRIANADRAFLSGVFDILIMDHCSKGLEERSSKETTGGEKEMERK